MARLSQGRNRRTGWPGAFGMTTCLSLAGLVLVTSCAEVMEDRGTVIQENRPVSGVMSAGPQDAAKAPSGATDGVPDSAPAPAVVREGAEEDGTVTFEGTGQFLGPRANRQATVTVRQGQVVINFENAELRDVVRTILGDTLKVSYIYDPRVQGLVSLQTTSALPTEAVLGTLETILRMNGAALLIDQGVYKVVPADEAIRGNTVPELGGPGFEPLPPGYAVKVVPLQYISAVQMDKLLAPFVPPEGVVRVDLDRNLIILAGNSQELRRLMDTVAIFDVDWLAGMSVGIFPLAHVSPETLIGELDAVFGSDADGPLAGLVKLVPVKRLNALLVVSTKPRYLEEVQTWVDRLDKGTAAGQNLYVYYLNNGKATEIAKILADIFSDRKKEDEQAQAPGRLAPGQEPAKVGEADAPPPPADAAAGAPPPADKPAEPPRPGRRRSEGLAFAKSGDIRIIADETNNALLVLADPADYRMVEAAIKKLDVVPLQVLVEATIAEVTLNDDLRYGVQWFFQHGGGVRDSTGQAILSAGTTSAIAASFPGFAYVINSSGGAPRLILSALEGVTNVNVISSPHVMIQDNQSAELEVGFEVPIVTQQQQSTSGEANLVNTVQYRNVGVILKVTPRVNTGGSINMEIEQEVSSVQATANPTLTPTITQRRVKSSIVVQHGETVVMGGMIQDQETKTNSGVPILSQLPLIGALFGTRSTGVVRTELLVLISPKVVRDASEARRVTQEIRQRVQTLKPFETLRKRREMPFQ